MSDAPLPELQASDLDSDTLAALFDDLEAAAERLEVIVKGGPDRRADPTPIGLREAQRLLVEGIVRGVQLRYVHEGRAWRDTLLRGATGIRIVRMEEP